MKVILYTIILFYISIGTCSAQIASTKDLNLNAIKRVELVEIPGDMTGRIFEYKVERTKGDNWVSKRTITYPQRVVGYEDEQEKLIREIPTSYLRPLVRSFANPILKNNIAEFKISKDTLISYLDSVSTQVSTDRKLANR